MEEIQKDFGGMLGIFFKRAWDCFYIFWDEPFFFFHFLAGSLEEILLLGWDLFFLKHFLARAMEKVVMVGGVFICVR